MSLVPLSDPKTTQQTEYAALMALSPRFRDVVGRVKVSSHQNIYEADFEYGKQPLRWEELTANGGTITHMPGSGGVRMQLAAQANSLTIRQSRPYHRYQAGKTMFMATAVALGPAVAGQVQRVGFFDDANGIFFEQATPTAANPFGIFVVVRDDVQRVPTDTRISYENFNGNPHIRQRLDWNRIQMMWMEYAWYGAGALRWGVFVDGEPIVLHQIGTGNSVGQVNPWARTGNLPVRYEQRNNAVTTVANTMMHYGVSVLVEGGQDDQRGFTYAYGTSQATNGVKSFPGATARNRVPIVAYRGRIMGTREAGNPTPPGGLALGAITAVSANSLTTTNAMTPGAYVGRYVAYGAAGAVPTIARITANTANVLTLVDPVLGGNPATAPVVGNNYTIGLPNRGQMLPRRLQIISTQPVFIEIFVSIPGSPLQLTSANFTTNAATINSFAEVDTSATAFTLSGECVYSLYVAANNPVDQPLDQLFPLYNVIRGNIPDTLAVVVTNPAGTPAYDISCQIIGQEAMS